ncbi:MAG: DUF2191 domain-containing protein [Gemmatimonadota bacterium]|nr:DUF2191 domain-containing protein [Gemmatimonadota bacterium]
MRTTVDLDADLIERLRVEAARRRVPFKQLLNATIRNGLANPPAPARKPYVLRPRRLGAVREGVNLDKALAVADAMEAVELAADLERGK